MSVEHFIVAAPLVATEAGQEYDTLPPYVAIFPWFDMPADEWPKFDEAMHSVVERAMQLTIQKIGPASVRTFGSESGHDLHTSVHKTVCRHRGDFDPSYVKEHWRPRISDGGSLTFNEGQEIILPEVAVFQHRVVTGKQMVRAVYKWESISHE